MKMWRNVKTKMKEERFRELNHSSFLLKKRLTKCAILYYNMQAIFCPNKGEIKNENTIIRAFYISKIN